MIEQHKPALTVTHDTAQIGETVIYCFRPADQSTYIRVDAEIIALTKRKIRIQYVIGDNVYRSTVYAYSLSY